MTDPILDTIRDLQTRVNVLTQQLHNVGAQFELIRAALREQPEAKSHPQIGDAVGACIARLIGERDSLRSSVR